MIKRATRETSEGGKSKKLNTDIVVIGAGGAGLTATLAAAEKGANVILLEKQKKPGGNSNLATGLFAVESPVQERMGLDIGKDALFKIAMEYSHWEINPRIVRAWLNKSGDTVRWLEQKGIEFDMVSFFYAGQVHPVYHVPKGQGSGAIKALVKNCEDQGIRILRQTRAIKILISEKGNVTGVLAATKEKEITITAKTVIIATGGYGGNRDLLKKYYPSYTDSLRYFGAPVMGDGLQMTTEIGANTEGLGELLIHGPFFHAPWLQAIILTTPALEPYTVWVNKRGERFVDEGTPLAFLETANALDRQPGKVSYHLFDERIKQKMFKDGFKKDAGEVYEKTFKVGSMLSVIDRQLHSEAAKGSVKISNSWDDIAKWIGSAPEALKATIDEYNHFCDQGYDEVFAKDPRYLLPLKTPPYYAIQCGQAFLDTTGGIKVNHHMEVLNQQDDPIPGLYAAGVAAGGWQSKTYCIVLSGSAFSFAFNSGRIAGENASEYAGRK